MTFVYLLALSVVLGVVGGLGLVLATKNEFDCAHGDNSHAHTPDTTIDEYYNDDSGTFKDAE